MCNLDGIDVISSGVCIAFLIYLVENKLAIDNISKLLSNMTIDEIRWGNEEIGPKLLKQIVNREGIGNILAEGSKIAAEKLGNDSENFAVHVNGLEIPGYDPRGTFGMGLAYAIGNKKRRRYEG